VTKFLFQVDVQNVSYAYSIFWRIRTYANVFYFSVRVSSSLAGTIRVLQVHNQGKNGYRIKSENETENNKVICRQWKVARDSEDTMLSMWKLSNYMYCFAQDCRRLKLDIIGESRPTPKTPGRCRRLRLLTIQSVMTADDNRLDVNFLVTARHTVVLHPVCQRCTTWQCQCRPIMFLWNHHYSNPMSKAARLLCRLRSH